MNPSKQEMNRLKVKANMKVIPEIHIKKNQVLTIISYINLIFYFEQDEKKKFIKAMLEEIDEFLVRQKEIDKKREKELNSIKYYS